MRHLVILAVICFMLLVFALKSDAKHPCIELKPLTSEKSSVNLTKVYIYTDRASTFKLP